MTKAKARWPAEGRVKSSLADAAESKRGVWQHRGERQMLAADLDPGCRHRCGVPRRRAMAISRMDGESRGELIVRYFLGRGGGKGGRDFLFGGMR